MLELTNKKEVNMFDKLLINHSAPTLAGIKIANIFTYHYDSKKELCDRIVFYNKLLGKRGIYLFVLKDFDSKVIVYVYNKEKLKNYIESEEISKFLCDCGYNSRNMYKNIQILSEKMKNYKNFPHEIGIFLGYPLIDICGFINNFGKNCLYSGYWKVYHNKNDAIKTFDSYNRCRLFYTNTFLEGKNILEIIESYSDYSNNIN